MMRRCVLGVAIAILIAGGVTFAQDQGRTARYEFTAAAEHQLIGPCGDYAIFAKYEVAVSVMDRYDKRNNLVQEILQARTIAPEVYWVGDPETFVAVPNTSEVTGVAGETEIDRIDFATGMAYGQGSIFQVTVPGYGRIFSETGHMATALTSPFTLLFNRGHNQLWEQDVVALCDYLMK
jgi:hypothetical protein